MWLSSATTYLADKNEERRDRIKSVWLKLKINRREKWKILRVTEKKITVEEYLIKNVKSYY